MDNPRIAYSYTRFSTPEQRLGASGARQSERAVAYCKAHNLHLDTTLHLNDEGISAYHGKNAKVGALGRFLAAAEAGRIPPGSVLVIENLDRLSRQNIGEAQETFKRILKLGVDIVTLCDEKLYTRETLEVDAFATIQAILFMSRAHEESEIKSKRVADAWARKRKRVVEDHHTLLTHRYPAWLRYDDTKKKFSPIPEKVKLIKKIFEFASEGHGHEKISRELNKRRIPAFRHPTWDPTAVRDMMSNRALIGELQLCRMVNGKRVPDGEPIRNYYPVVLDPAVFHLVQSKRQAPLKGPRQHNGEVHSLFSGCLTCGYCGASMLYLDKRQGNQRYLVCAEAKKGSPACKYTSMKYDEFEESFLGLCKKEIDLPTLFNDRELKKLSESIIHLQKSISGTEATIADNRSRTEKLIAKFADTTNKELLHNYESYLTKLTAETDTLLNVVAKKKQELIKLKSAQGTIHDMVKTVAEAYDEGDRIKHDHELRARIRNVIRDIVDEIVVFPGGANRKATVDRLFAFLKGERPSGSVAAETDKYIKCYAVRFKNGATTRMSLMAPNKGKEARA